MSRFKTNIDFVKLKKSIVSRAKKGLKLSAKKLLEDSNSKVPIDTGRLKKSGIVNTSELGEMKTAVKYTADYAFYQHENSRLKHKKGEAMYLENTLIKNKAKYIEIIANEIKGAL